MSHHQLLLQKKMKIRDNQQFLLLQTTINPASQLRGLTFGNKIDELLGGGLIPKTLTFLYGENANSMLNTLCSNAVRIFGGKAMYIDAANSFDPYFIVQHHSNHRPTARSEKEARHFIESILVSRAFTCYQLRKLVAGLESVIASRNKKADEDGDDSQKITSVFVSGISSVFNEQDNTEREINCIELLMAQSLQKLALNKNNQVLFVVASSNSYSMNFQTKSDTVIKLYHEGKRKAKNHHGVESKAILMKHYARCFQTVTL